MNTKLKNSWTPLLLAASIGNPDVVDELIDRGADVNDFNGNIFRTSLRTCKSNSCVAQIRTPH